MQVRGRNQTLGSQELLSERIEKVAEHLRARLGRKADAAAAEAFARRLFDRASPDDLNLRPVEVLYGAAQSLWNFADRRPPGSPRLRAFNPSLDRDGWSSRHTVVQVVNDDMPFLVDSTTMALAGLGHGLHLILHPILTIRRDESGRRLAEGGEPIVESVMHLEIDRQSDPAALAEIEARLREVLADVRVVVGDWQAMRDELDRTLAQLGERPPPLDAAEVDEAAALLTWMRDDHFTFMGFREYDYLAEEEGGDGEPMRIQEGSGRGILRDPARRVMVGREGFAPATAAVRAFLRRPELLIITKANARSTVHRPVHLDYVGVRRFDAAGRAVGERRFVGLFTSAAYNRTPRDIPLLRRKVLRVVERSGLAPASHDGKALLNILDNFPRDELFQINEDDLFAFAHGILLLQQRPRVRLFLRRDEFGRYASCLVYVPRERHHTELRRRFEAILAEALGGRISAVYTQMGDEPLARLHFIVATPPGTAGEVDAAAVEARLAEAARSWEDSLGDALLDAHGEEAGNRLRRRYGDAFPGGYRDRFDAAAALSDIAQLERLGGPGDIAVNLYRPLDAGEAELRFKLYHRGGPVPLSDCLPMLENMGIRVISEHPFEVWQAGAAAADWVHDFVMHCPEQEFDLGRMKDVFEAAFAAVWQGKMEDDRFNRLVLRAGLQWREVMLIRAYCKFLRQTGIPFSQAYMEDALNGNPDLARRLVELFHALFDPAGPADRDARVAELETAFAVGLETVASLDDDRILRRFLNAVQATLRTSFYQTGPDGQPRPYLALKFDSGRLADLPLPRPMVEIFVQSPDLEAVHMRGGRVARGGIRWSDRREDFRTEILGLLKAQMVKNAVIVPVGAKGGFFPKRPPAEGGREAVQADALDCYRTYVRAMLDITDNRVGDVVMPPLDVVRRDGDDPYLVVAADKGTASFSDAANAISLEYGFWMGDAFASGGSAGYDHKGMGITARGAWESVKRHFRELGHDVQRQPFTVAGIGDMSGDVFGNGMLRSRCIRLVAAFDHRHIFVDPDPDPEAGFEERSRLFALPRSSWADYRRELLSPGGGIFERSAKSIDISPEIARCLSLAPGGVTPNELIRAILRAEVDLLWFGGIGTYVKASTETHMDVGDRATDAVRVDGAEIRARVIGEGANLGCTQRGRIEYALAGGRINTDAIDNSGGVDCSDHEVNIKILLNAVVAEGDLTLKQRDRLLEEMTEEVAELVLQDNYLQTQAISVAMARGRALLASASLSMRELERQGRLDRAVEFLPTDAELAARDAAGLGLTRPETAVLLAYAKTSLYSDLLDSDLPDDPYFGIDLQKYFPRPLRRRFGAAIERHRLRREIVATAVANSIINRVGPGFVADVREQTQAGAAEIARAYALTREVFGLRRIWTAVEALDNQVPAALQTAMLLSTVDLARRAVIWFLRRSPGGIDIAASLAVHGPGAADLAAALERSLAPDGADRLARRIEDLRGQGVPEDLARAVAGLQPLGSAPDIVEAALRCKRPVAAVAQVYFALGERLGLDWLRQAAAAAQPGDGWQRMALAAAVDDLHEHQRALAVTVLTDAPSEQEPLAALAEWEGCNQRVLAHLSDLLAEYRAAGGVDAARLAIANRRVRAACPQ